MSHRQPHTPSAGMATSAHLLVTISIDDILATASTQYTALSGSKLRTIRMPSVSGSTNSQPYSSQCMEESLDLSSQSRKELRNSAASPAQFSAGYTPPSTAGYSSSSNTQSVFRPTQSQFTRPLARDDGFFGTAGSQFDTPSGYTNNGSGGIGFSSATHASSDMRTRSPQFPPGFHPPTFPGPYVAEILPWPANVAGCPNAGVAQYLTSTSDKRQYRWSNEG